MMALASQLSWLMTPTINAMDKQPKLVFYTAYWDWAKLDFAWWAPLLPFAVLMLGYLAWAPYKYDKDIEKKHAERETQLTAEINALKQQSKWRDDCPLIITAVEKVIGVSHSTFPAAKADEERCQILVTNNSVKTIDWVKIELVDIYEPILKKQSFGSPLDLPLLLAKKDGSQPGTLHPGAKAAVDLFEATLGINHARESTVHIRLAHQGIIAVLVLDAEFDCRLRVTAKDTAGNEANYRVNFSASTHRFTMSPPHPTGC
jgi:hypothetical protein